MIRSVHAGGGAKADFFGGLGSRCASINRFSSATSATPRTLWITK